jgi:hypothetical protein
MSTEGKDNNGLTFEARSGSTQRYFSNLPWKIQIRKTIKKSKNELNKSGTYTRRG